MNTSGKKGAQRLIPDMETFAETVAHGFAVGSTTASMKNVDSAFHVTGRSIYLDDIPVQQGTLYALPYDAPSALSLIHI